MCEALLLENVGGVASYADAASSSTAATNTDSKAILLPFTSHQLLLPLPSVFGRRSVVDIQFSARRNGLILVAYSKPILNASASTSASASASASSLSPTSPSAKAAAESSNSSDSKSMSRGQVPSTFLDHKGLLCLWDLNNPKQPSRSVSLCSVFCGCGWL